MLQKLFINLFILLLPLIPLIKSDPFFEIKKAKQQFMTESFLFEFLFPTECLILIEFADPDLAGFLFQKFCPLEIHKTFKLIPIQAFDTPETP